MQTSDNDADVETESATTTTMMDDDDFREEEDDDDPGSIIAQTTGRNGFDAKAHQRRAAALKPRTGRVKTRGGTRAGTTHHYVLGGAAKKTNTKVVARSHARLGVSPVRGGRGEKKMKESFLARKKEKKKRSVQQKRERREKRRYSLDDATSDDDDHDGGGGGGGGGGTDEDTEQQKRRRDTTNTTNVTTAMEREDAKRRQLLYKRLDRLKQLPKNSKFAISQIALVNKCLEMLMKVTVRTNEEEDELAKLLSSVKI